jgi:hypothetical protein
MRLAGKTSAWAKNLSQSHFVHHKSNMDWPVFYGGQSGTWTGFNKLFKRN